MQPDLLDKLLRSLPPSLHNLTILQRDMYRTSSTFLAIRRHLQPLAPSLRTLTLLDPPLQKGQLELFATNRGVLDNLLVTLTSLERLTIGPCAVSRLGMTAGLTKLPKLEELRIEQGAARPAPGVTPEEVVEFMQEAKALKVLQVVGGRQHWAKEKRAELAAKAAHLGVEYTA